MAQREEQKDITIEDFFVKRRLSDEHRKHLSDARKGKPGPNLGKTLSEEHKRKLSEAGKGKKHSEETKRKIARKGKAHAAFGKHPSEETRRKLSNARKGANNHNFGKTYSQDLKQKLRLAKIKRFQELGIAACADEGASEWFDMMKELGYNFIQGYCLKEQGYFADGYEPEKHIWMEYDTPYHQRGIQKTKDLTRQQNIIRHFENIGNPLKQFVRVDMTRPDRMGIEVVYRPI